VETEIRLRGIGVARVISHNDTTANNSNSYLNTNRTNWSSKANPSFINLSDILGYTGTLTLALEDKVTLKGLGYDANPGTTASAYKYYGMVDVDHTYCFIMRAGSRITEHNTRSPSYLRSVINVGYWNNAWKGKFIMAGGKIDNNKLARSSSNSIGNGIIMVKVIGEQVEGMIVILGGTIADNVIIHNSTYASEECRSVNLAGVEVTSIDDFRQ
jgi:hypothetical protein